MRSAVSKQRAECRVGANHPFALFCVVSGCPNAAFVIPNTSSCHSEHREESRLE
ncbi:putative lipoprotein [Tannerella forsythia KS16]|nr:putative lipoprotein [Tannerella forsythia KS16]